MKISSILLLVISALLFVAISTAQPPRIVTGSVIPAPTPTPPDQCPSTGSGFEIPLNQMPIPHPTPHPIDSLCPRGGSDDHNTDHRIQNAAKNDFTVKGNPIMLGFNDFTNLQKATDQKIASGQIKLVSGGYPQNRAASLKEQITVQGKKIGEGTLVTLEAYVFGAHYSNTKFNVYPGNQHGSGEANNCKCNRIDWNDIHIALSESADASSNECESVTAEISPHYRSEIWSKFHDGGIPEIEAMLPGLLQHRVVDHHGPTDQPLKVRIAGPLFYDASHQPCHFNNAGAVTKHNSPARRTIWEIHPVYRIQLFDSAKNKWVDLS